MVTGKITEIKFTMSNDHINGAHEEMSRDGFLLSKTK